MEASRGPDGRETACGGVLEGLEGLILPQALGKVICRLCIEAVVLQAASMSQMEASAGPDGGETARGGVLEGGEGLVLL